MTRREDWPERLLEVIERHSRLPFGWDTSDCWRLPADCVAAMTGADPWPEVKGRYTTEIGAARHLRRRGWHSVADAFAHFFEEIPVPMARRGDIGVVADPKGPAGVVFVDNGVVGKGEQGIRRLPRSAAVRAFRV